jgi:hypothetical protein
VPLRRDLHSRDTIKTPLTTAIHAHGVQAREHQATTSRQQKEGFLPRTSLLQISGICGVKWFCAVLFGAADELVEVLCGDVILVDFSSHIHIRLFFSITCACRYGYCQGLLALFSYSALLEPKLADTSYYYIWKHEAWGIINISAGADWAEKTNAEV